MQAASLQSKTGHPYSTLQAGSLIDSMIEFHSDPLSDLRADVLVIEVDCVGRVTTDLTTLGNDLRNEIIEHYRQQFDLGAIEPGRILSVERSGDGPSRIQFFPTRVHTRGQVRDECVQRGTSELLELALRDGTERIAVAELLSHDASAMRSLKTNLLGTFGNVPQIKIVLCSHVSNAKQRKRIVLFTDGGAEPNPGVGGYGVVLRFAKMHKELSGGFQHTSNNRMELLAAIVGLEALKEPCRVRLHSDSRYVIDTVTTGLLFRSVIHDPSKSTKLKNADLWKRFLAAYLIHDVEMIWVKGHAGIADNERCDELASQAIRSSDLLNDVGYQRFGDGKSKKKKTKTKPCLSSPSLTTSTTKASNQAVTTNKPSSPTITAGTKPKKIGDLCRKCSTPLIRRETKKHKANAAYWYEWYLVCTSCQRMYLVEEAKIQRDSKKEP